MKEREELHKYTCKTAKSAWFIYATYWIFPEVSLGYVK